MDLREECGQFTPLLQSWELASPSCAGGCVKTGKAKEALFAFLKPGTAVVHEAKSHFRAPNKHSRKNS